MSAWRVWGVSLVGCLALTAAEPPAPPVFHRAAGNLLQNSSLEYNWNNRKFTANRRFLLLQTSDMGVGEEDGHVDHWRVEGPKMPEAWDLTTARAGTRSLRFDHAGRAMQLVRFAGEQYWIVGGAHYGRYLPLAPNLALKLHRRPLVVGAWCRTREVPAGSAPRLTVSVQSSTRNSVEAIDAASSRTMSADVAFGTGTHEWEYRQVRVEPKPLDLPSQPPRNALDDQLAPDATLPLDQPPPQYEDVPWYVTVTVAAGEGGTVWFDDVSCCELPEPRQANVLPGGNFEALDDQGWPLGWSAPAPWGWFRNTYYLFTGWSHGGGKTRGGVVVDPLVACGGRRSLRFQVFPGDNVAVTSAPMTLNQAAAAPIEVRAMVKADSLRTLELMATDQSGQFLPQGDFLGDDMEEPGVYNFGTTGSGTYDWFCVRKYFSPRGPVKTLRVLLCARGFDGVLVEHNLVGTVWWDDVQVFDHGAALVPPPGAPSPVPAAAAWPFRIADFQLGDRLWGRNLARFTLAADDAAGLAAAREIKVSATLTAPDGTVTQSESNATVVPAATGQGGSVQVEIPYAVERCCANWQEQYRLALEWHGPSATAVPPQVFAFGTPSRLLTAGTNALYLYPEEPLVVYANLNASRAAFAGLSHAEVVLRAGDQVVRTIRFDRFAETLRPQRGPDYINTRGLFQVRTDHTGFAVHSWREPVLDGTAVVRLFRTEAAGPALVTESAPLPFGFMEPVPPPDLPAVIERTGVNADGYITVNGRPWFPVFFTPHFGIRPEADYPPQSFGYKALDLTEIVYSKKQAPDEEVKAAVQAAIRKVKDDPKFFQYELGEGEMQCQGGWQERLGWCRQALPWIREADPKHLINGPISWLVGHPGHNGVMPQFAGQWDVIGVEASFEHQPQVKASAWPAMKERRTAVLVGLETYFTQSNETLRWRAYRSVLNGANGIGLCPSGMLQARPDKENYLRGLNGEFRGLAPIIMAPQPAARLTGDSPLVETMERDYDGKRYVLAVRDAGGGPVTVNFRFPAGERWPQVRVRSEGRTIPPMETGFADRFAGYQTVHVYELSR